MLKNLIVITGTTNKKLSAKIIQRKIVNKLESILNCKIEFQNNEVYKYSRIFGKLFLNNSILTLSWKENKLYIQLESSKKEEYINLINLTSYILYLAKCKVKNISSHSLIRWDNVSNIEAENLVIANFAKIKENIPLDVDFFVRNFPAIFADINDQTPLFVKIEKKSCNDEFHDTDKMIGTKTEQLNFWDKIRGFFEL